MPLRGLGWTPDLPDPRDFTMEEPTISARLDRLIRECRTLPKSVDVRQDEDGVYFSSPRDQGRVNAAPAFAVLSLIEYFERKFAGNTFDGSPLFLFKMAQRLSGASGNAPVSIRTTLKALKRYGVPPEEMFPFSDDPSGLPPSDVSLLGFPVGFSDLIYFRVDGRNQRGKTTLKRVKRLLAGGLPVTFGFSVPRSINDQADIHYRPRFDSYRGGQVALAVGYDDEHFPGGQGGLRIRLHWGIGWGESGYGWIPYSLVKRGQARDFWAIAPPPADAAPR